MHNIAIPEAGLYKLVILVASIVVSVFCSTVLVALVFMPSQVFWSIPTEDVRFLIPMALATVCSGFVLTRYIQSQRSRLKE